MESAQSTKHSCKSEKVIIDFKDSVRLTALGLTKSGVISRCIVMSPTTSFMSPSRSKITAQLAVGDVSDILLPPVALSGNVFLKKSPFWSLPKADISDTAPFNLWRPSAMFRPTPPPENFVSDLYVAPLSCGRKQTKKDFQQWNENDSSLEKLSGKKFEQFIAREHVKK